MRLDNDSIKCERRSHINLNFPPQDGFAHFEWEWKQNKLLENFNVIHFVQCCSSLGLVFFVVSFLFLKTSIIELMPCWIHRDTFLNRRQAHFQGQFEGNVLMPIHYSKLFFFPFLLFFFFNRRISIKQTIINAD